MKVEEELNVLPLLPLLGVVLLLPPLLVPPLLEPPLLLPEEDPPGRLKLTLEGTVNVPELMAALKSTLLSVPCTVLV